MWVVRAGQGAVFYKKFLDEKRIFIPWDGFCSDLKDYKCLADYRSLVEKEKNLESIKESRKEPVEGIIRDADRDPDMLALIRRAIKDGFSDDEIRIITDRDISEDLRSELYEAIRLRI